MGNIGEPDSTSVTRLIQNDGRWFLFVLTDPSLTRLEVSWHPVYDSTGIGVRSWTPVEIQDGVGIVAAPGQAVAAKVRIGRQQGRTVLTAPVVQDSADLKDPSFFPVELTGLTPLSGSVDVPAGHTQRVTWLANQLSAVTGVTVGQLRIVVLWSAGKDASADVLASFGLPGGGTIVAYAGPLTSGYSNPPVAILPVANDSDAFTVTAWKNALVYAPTRPTAAVTASDDHRIAATGVLNSDGVAAIALPEAAGTIRTVTVGASTWAPKVVLDLTDRAHTDPFDLRS